jgi:hypothetical protein
MMSSLLQHNNYKSHRLYLIGIPKYMVWDEPRSYLCASFGARSIFFHMQSLPFYLDEVTIHKEVTSWPRVTIENKKMGVSYVMPTISQRSSPTKTSDVGPSMRKRTQNPSSSEEEVYEGKEEALSSDTLQIPFSSILDYATISGKKFQEVPT